MNKYTLPALLFASLSSVILPATAVDVHPAAQKYIDAMVSTNTNLNEDLAIAITKYPMMSESLVIAATSAVGPDSDAAADVVATALTALGTDSPLTDNILVVAAESGIDNDTIIAVAIANGVDPTTVTETLGEATAAGPAPTAIPTPAAQNNIAPQTSRAPQSSAAGGGGGLTTFSSEDIISDGGGGGGISPNQ